MLNPDGVIVGNYRTNLAARDLNRTYKDPKKVRDLFADSKSITKEMKGYNDVHELVKGQHRQVKKTESIFPGLGNIYHGFQWPLPT